VCYWTEHSRILVKILINTLLITSLCLPPAYAGPMSDAKEKVRLSHENSKNLANIFFLNHSIVFLSDILMLDVIQTFDSDFSKFSDELKAVLSGVRKLKEKTRDRLDEVHNQHVYPANTDLEVSGKLRDYLALLKRNSSLVGEKSGKIRGKAIDLVRDTNKWSDYLKVKWDDLKANCTNGTSYSASVLGFESLIGGEVNPEYMGRKIGVTIAQGIEGVMGVSGGVTYDIDGYDKDAIALDSTVGVKVYEGVGFGASGGYSLKGQNKGKGDFSLGVNVSVFENSDVDIDLGLSVNKDGKLGADLYVSDEEAEQNKFDVNARYSTNFDNHSFFINVEQTVDSVLKNETELGLAAGIDTNGNKIIGGSAEQKFDGDVSDVQIKTVVVNPGEKNQNASSAIILGVENINNAPTGKDDSLSVNGEFGINVDHKKGNIDKIIIDPEISNNNSSESRKRLDELPGLDLTVETPPNIERLDFKDTRNNKVKLPQNLGGLGLTIRMSDAPITNSRTADAIIGAKHDLTVLVGNFLLKGPSAPIGAIILVGSVVFSSVLNLFSINKINKIVSERLKANSFVLKNTAFADDFSTHYVEACSSFIADAEPSIVEIITLFDKGVDDYSTKNLDLIAKGLEEKVIGYKDKISTEKNLFFDAYERSYSESLKKNEVEKFQANFSKSADYKRFSKFIDNLDSSKFAFYLLSNLANNFKYMLKHIIDSTDNYNFITINGALKPFRSANSLHDYINLIETEIVRVDFDSNLDSSVNYYLEPGSDSYVADQNLHKNWSQIHAALLRWLSEDLANPYRILVEIKNLEKDLDVQFKLASLPPSTLESYRNKIVSLRLFFEDIVNIKHDYNTQASLNEVLSE